MKELVDAATRARANAHAPYSGFSVGAAVRDELGRIHIGCNVENASYPEGICAETAAVAAMVAAGGRRIDAVAIVAEGAAPCTPCGGCRQRLREFAAPQTPVHCAGPEGLRRSYTLGELLPDSFGPESLG
jgi:cytidine deaminase